MIGIYKITNKLNGKSYIGQSIHCGKRLDEHCRGEQLIDKIIQLEGIENFNFEILKNAEKKSYLIGKIIILRNITPCFLMDIIEDGIVMKKLEKKFNRE